MAVTAAYLTGYSKHLELLSPPRSLAWLLTQRFSEPPPCMAFTVPVSELAGGRAGPRFHVRVRIITDAATPATACIRAEEREEET